MEITKILFCYIRRKIKTFFKLNKRSNFDCITMHLIFNVEIYKKKLSSIIYFYHIFIIFSLYIFKKVFTFHSFIFE